MRPCGLIDSILGRRATLTCGCCTWNRSCLPEPCQGPSVDGPNPCVLFEFAEDVTVCSWERIRQTGQVPEPRVGFAMLAYKVWGRLSEQLQVIV
jgi:hypothetical protein